MNLVHISTKKMSDFNPQATGAIYSIALEIPDIGKRAQEILQVITNTSWLAPLDIIDQATYAARSKPTIDKIVNDILSKVGSSITDEFGEYMVSDSGQTALEQHLNHIRAPLADLIKEKISGNPGFDFHTESPNTVITFGEAKYSGVQSAHGRALSQIGDFIGQKKDIQELSDIRKFFSDVAIQNAASGKKSFCAAFSIVSDDIDTIMKNALNSTYMGDLLCYEAVYLIGVKVSA